MQKRASGPQRPNRLENGGNTGAVICGTRSGFDAVVMSYKKERGAAILSAGYSRENVLHSSGVGIACANASGMLNLRLEAQDAELRDQVVAHPIMLCTPNRMRPLRHGNHMLHCALCRKHCRWSIVWNGNGWTTHTLRKRDAYCDRQERNEQPLNLRCSFADFTKLSVTQEALGREIFADFDIRPDGQAVVLAGEMDQAALHGVLNRIQALGLELVGVVRLG